MKTVSIRELYDEIIKQKPYSAWSKGVKQYAVDLLESEIEDNYGNLCFKFSCDLEKMLLSGASVWQEYSEGGCALIYNEDICRRLCPPYLIKKKKNGSLQPNSEESWIDVQARALHQAWRLIQGTFWAIQQGKTYAD